MKNTYVPGMRKSRRWWISLCQWLWGKRGFFWGTLCLGIFLNVFAAWLYTPSSTDFKRLPIGWAFQNPLIILLGGICLLLLTGMVGLIGRFDKTLFLTHSNLPLHHQNRQWLIARVNAFWIEGVLKQSLHEATLIELKLSEQSDVIMNPWKLAMQEIDRPVRPLPMGTSILQVYDLTDGELLILGEPGSGKTTLLLQLTRDLLDHAKKNDTHPIPVIFNLSSWAVKQQSLADWLIEELNTKYQVPLGLGESWVNENYILPLLDGLDEVIPTARLACIHAINSYRREHGTIPTIICSRSAEYLALEEQLLLRSAVIVQPLSKQQIDDFLASAGKQLETVREALQKDRELQAMVSTPLMLNVLTMAYHGRSVENILVTDLSETRRQQVFAAYIQRVLQRRGVETRYDAKRTVLWLSWLAWQMIQHKQTEIIIDQMQLDWLPTSLSSWLDHNTVVATLVGIIFAVLSSLFQRDVTNGIAIGLVCGLLVFLLLQLRGTVRKPSFSKIMSLPWMKWIRRNLSKVLENKWILGLFVGFIVGLLLAIPGNFRNGIFRGLTFGWLNILTMVLIAIMFGLLERKSRLIELVILKFFLWLAKSMPWDYRRFLNYASERILLRKIGTGYIFIHRLLLEYFATLYPTNLRPNPVDAQTYLNRGNAYHDLKQYQRAIQDFDRAIELNPKDAWKDAWAYGSRGSAYSRLKQYQRAIQDFDRAIELSPNYTWAYDSRGIVYRELERYERAVQDFDRAIELSPNYARAYESRGIAYLWLKNASQAKENFNRCYELDSTNINSLWLAEWIDLSKMSLSRGMSIRLEEIAKIDPENYLAYVCRSVASGVRGNIKAGLEEIENAISLDPEEYDAYFWKGMLSAYYYQGQSHERERMAMKAIEMALGFRMPPILLKPLYWFEHNNPVSFERWVKPLLEQYEMVDREE